MSVGYLRPVTVHLVTAPFDIDRYIRIDIYETYSITYKYHVFHKV